jgi:quinol monooxygenase YgiN
VVKLAEIEHHYVIPPGRVEHMSKVGFLVELDTRDGKEADLAAFLQDAKTLVDAEPGTVYWFAFRRGERSFAIFDVFNDEDARTVHLHGEVRKALEARGPEFLAKQPAITPVDVEAWKVP